MMNIGLRFFGGILIIEVVIISLGEMHVLIRRSSSIHSMYPVISGFLKNGGFGNSRAPKFIASKFRIRFEADML